MDTIHLQQDFKDFLKLLNSHKVEYQLIVAYYHLLNCFSKFQKFFLPSLV